MKDSVQIDALVLLASEGKIEQLIHQTESGFKKSVMKLGAGVSAAFSFYNPKTYAQIGAVAAISAAAIKKDGLNKQTVKNIQEASSALLNLPTASESYEIQSAQDKLKKLKELLDIECEIIHIPFSEKDRLRILPASELTEDGTFLRQLPSGKYTKLTHFESFLAKERITAFKNLASALGACEIKLVSFEVKENAKEVKNQATREMVAAQLGVNIAILGGNIREEAYSATFNSISKMSFKIPKECKYWIEEDQELENLVNGRKNQRLKKIKTSLHFRETSQVFSQFAAKLAGKGFDIGGAYRKSYETHCTFEVEFH